MIKGREILCDSGSFISLTSACLDKLVYYFSDKFNVKFIIPPGVEKETVTVPMRRRIRKYLYSAIRIKEAIDENKIIPIDEHAPEDAKEIINIANNLYYVKGKPLKLIHEGESEMLALAIKLGVDYVLIDERTTRLLIEAPFSIKKHLEEEFKVNIMVNKKNLDRIKEMLAPIKAIRSSELVMLSYETGFFDKYHRNKKEALEAALFRIKTAGCSTSFREIEEYLRSIS